MSGLIDYSQANAWVSLFALGRPTTVMPSSPRGLGHSCELTKEVVVVAQLGLGKDCARNTDNAEVESFNCFLLKMHSLDRLVADAVPYGVISYSLSTEIFKSVSKNSVLSIRIYAWVAS